MKGYLNRFIVILSLLILGNCTKKKGGVFIVWEKIALGFGHSCVLFKEKGEVKCWGDNTFGQLGLNAAISGAITDVLGDNPGEIINIPPINLGAGRTAKDIYAGSLSSCAILDDDTVKCWGNNQFGQLGQDNFNALGNNAGEMAALQSINLGGGRTAKSISMSMDGDHVCAILDDNSLKCWGRNHFGQLGLGNTNDQGDNAGEMAALPSVNLGAGRTAKAVAAGVNHTCVILNDDSVMCWGRNNRGQLGLNAAIGVGTITDTQGDNPGEVMAIPSIMLGQGASAISLGNSFSCALLFDDSVKCWGRNDRGQLGLDDANERGDNPGEIVILPSVNLGLKAKAISSGPHYNCALLIDNTMKCWGDNTFGQLGLNAAIGGGAITDDVGDNPGEMAALPPVHLGNNQKVWFSFVCGFGHTCAILDSGNGLKCWGRNSDGELGLGDTSTRGDNPGEMDTLGNLKWDIYER